MKRFGKCLRFTLGRTARITAVFIGIYILCCALYLLLTFTRAANAKGYFSYDLFNVSLFFSFIAVAVTYSLFWNSLLLFGNTRRAIYVVSAANTAVLAAVLAVLCALSSPLNFRLAGLLGLHSVNLLKAIYPDVPDGTPGGFLLWLLLYFSALLAVSGAALLYGALHYRFGKRFILVFWVGFGLVMTLLSGALADARGNGLLPLAESYFGNRRPGGIEAASLHLLLTALVFGALAWLPARRQEQRGTES